MGGGGERRGQADGKEEMAVGRNGHSGGRSALSPDPLRGSGWRRALVFSSLLHLAGVAWIARLGGEGDASPGKAEALLPVSVLTPVPDPEAAPSDPFRSPPVDWSPDRVLPETVHPPSELAPPDLADRPLIDPTPAPTVRPAPLDYGALIPTRFEEPAKSRSALPPSPPAAASGATDGLEWARPMSAIQPVYPRTARREGWEGVVIVRLAIDERGAVRSTAIAESSGVAWLDEAALSAVRGATFKPAMRGGRPVADEMRMRIRFQLTDAE